MKLISSKKILAAVIMAALCVLFCFSASAAECVCDGFVVWSFNRDTQMLECPDCKNVFELGDYSGFANDKETGILMRFTQGAPTKGWVAYVDDNYYFGEDGMALTGQQVIDGKTYTFDDEGRFVKGCLVDEPVIASNGQEMILTRYYGPGGKPVMRWAVIDGELYYFSKAFDYTDLPEDGAMYRGGEFVIRTAGANSKRKFTFAVDGRLIGGCWEEEKDSNGAYIGKRYYWGPDYVTGDFKIDGVTYTFDEQGYLVTRDINVTTIEVDYSVPGAIEPGIVVTDNGGEVLTNGVHYTLAYQDNIGTCTGVIRIKGIVKGGYTGTKKQSFNIKHTAEVKKEAVAPTCTTEGFTAGTFCEACQSWASGHETVPALGHKWTDNSCANETKTCSVCKVKQTVNLHTEEIIPGKAATCTEKGLSDGKKCTVCGKITVAQKETAPVGHKEEIIPGKAGSCFEKGISDGKKCTVCGVITVPQKESASFGHKEVELPAKAATCTEDGLTAGRKCTECGKITVSQDFVRALGHKYITVPARPATCTEPGLTAGEECVRCGKVKTAREEIPATGHYWQGATCETAEVCTGCGLTKGSALGHKGIAVPEKAPTYSSEGLTEGVKCEVCGKEIVPQEKTGFKKLSKVTNLKVSSVKTTEIKLTWKKVTGAKKYKLSYSTNGKTWKSVTTTKTSYTVKKLKSGTSYRFKVSAVAGENTGAASSILKTATKVSKVTLSSVKSTKAKQAVVSWKTVNGASGYVVEYSTSKSFKNKKTATLKKGTTKKTTLKKLTSGKKYYVRVKAYKTVNGEKVYGSASSVKTVKVK